MTVARSDAVGTRPRPSWSGASRLESRSGTCPRSRSDPSRDDELPLPAHGSCQ